MRDANAPWKRTMTSSTRHKAAWPPRQCRGLLHHSFAKQVLDAGADLATVSRLLGHERLEMTAIYTQPTTHDLEAAVRRLERDGAQD